MTYNKGKGKAVQWLCDHVSYDGDECLIWPFCTDSRGRGHFGHLGKHYRAPRFMCELAHGPCPDGLECTHSCGNGHLGCVNPKHMSWDTRSKNHLDRRKHGTHATNRWGSRTRLTLEQIAEIRALKGKEPKVATAKRFGISSESVRRWQETTRDPVPPGSHPSSIRRREMNAA